MNPSSIYSKTGKGMQEASGRTSLLPRATRKLLAEVDGRSSLHELLKKFPDLGGGKLESAIAQMENEGFIRELPPAQTAGAARPQAPAARPQAPPPPADDGEELDFTAVFAKPDPAKAREEAERREKEEAQRKAQEGAALKARQEAEAKAKALAEAQARAKAMAEAKARADAEAQAKAEAEAKAKALAEAQARVKAMAEAKARADAEAKAKAEAESQARREAEEKARKEAEAREAGLKAKLEDERKAREAAERKAKDEAEAKARRESEELRRHLEEQRKALEETERKAKQEAERITRETEEKARREAGELRQKLEAAERKAKEETERRAREDEERKRREEAERRANAEAEQKAREAAARREKEEAERKVREDEERKRKLEDERRARDEAERKARAEAEQKAREAAARKEKEEAERKAQEETGRRAREEAESKARAEAERKRREEEGRKREAEQKAAEKAAAEKAAAAKAAAEKAPVEKAPAKAADADGFADSLMADLDSFADQEEEEAKKKEEEDRKRKQAEARATQEAEDRARRDAEERKGREAEERKTREADERRRREQAATRALEEAERKVKEEEERSRREAQERKRKAEDARPAGGAATAEGSLPLDQDTQDPGQDETTTARDARRAARERERDASRAKRAAEAAAAAAAMPAAAPKRPIKWGRTVAIGLFVVLVGGLGLVHVMPLSSSDYSKALSEAIGQPVKIGSVNLSLYSGVELKMENVQIGEGAKIARVHASPEMGSLFGEKKAFTQVQLDDAVIPEAMLGELLFGSMKGDGMRIGKLRFADLKVEGSLGLPKLTGELSFADGGKVKSITLKGGGETGITGQILPSGESAEFTINAESTPVPFVPGLNLSSFGMKGSANRQEMTVKEFDGRVYDGVISGNARIRWSGGWSVAGDVAAKQINAAVFAPTLISEGKLDANGRYVLAGAEPGKLGPDGRLEGSFTITKGVIGSVDLAKVLQNPNAAPAGRTAFSEMTGRGAYHKGAIEVRDVRVTAGLLNATAVLDIDAAGGLSGKMNAEVKSATTNAHAALIITGKVADPQVRR